MYLIECQEDNSLTIVEDFDVVCDENMGVKEGDLVKFYVGEKTFEGPVKACGDKKILKTRQKQLLREYKKNSSKQSEKVTSVVSPINTRQKVQKDPPVKDSVVEKKDKKRKKKEEKASVMKSKVETQKEVAALIRKGKGVVKVSSSESSDEDKPSPFKAELKAQLQKLRASHRGSNLLEVTSKSALSLKTKIDEVISSEDETDPEEKNVVPPKKAKVETKVGDVQPTSSQLFGKDHVKPMTQLGDSGVYCITNIHDYALSGKKVTHIARRLIDGVFTKDAIASCTFTGQPPRAQGKERQIIPVSPLDDTAKNAIIDFAIEKGQSRQIEIPDRNIIMAQMSQRLGEIKREISLKSVTS